MLIEVQIVGLYKPNQGEQEEPGENGEGQWRPWGPTCTQKQNKKKTDDQSPGENIN